MKGSDRIILVGLPVLALLAGFWFLAISPKREEAAELQDRIDGLHSSIEAAEGQIAAAEAARDAFPKNYGSLVTLGRAVPEDGDQATLVYDIAGLSGDNDLDFREFEVLPGGTGAELPEGVTATPAPTTPAQPGAEAPAGTEGAEGAEGGAEPAPETSASGAAAATPATNALATEATAAALPIGATVGPAGLPTMPYEFKFLGGFFDMADFFADLDDNVEVSKKGPEVSGRLLTIDGFSFTGDQFTGFPDVEANFSVTSYVVPAAEGLAAGATPAGPAASAPGDSTTVSTPPATSAAVTP